MTFRELRKRQNLSLRQAAVMLGVHYQAICRYENKARIPRTNILIRMKKVYKCTEDELAEAIKNNLIKRDGDKCA